MQAHRQPLRPRGPGVVAALVLTFAMAPLAACAGSEAPGSAEADKQQTTTVPTTVREPVTHEFVIPAGTADRLARDEEVDVIPPRIELRAGDRIQVRNDDNQLARLGIFDVGPGDTVSMAFNTPGEIEGTIFSDASGGCGAPPPDVKTFIVHVTP